MKANGGRKRARPVKGARRVGRKPVTSASRGGHAAKIAEAMAAIAAGGLVPANLRVGELHRRVEDTLKMRGYFPREIPSKSALQRYLRSANGSNGEIGANGSIGSTRVLLSGPKAAQRRVMSEPTTGQTVSAPPAAAASAASAEARVVELEAELATARSDLAETRALLVESRDELHTLVGLHEELFRRLGAFAAALQRFELADAPPASPALN